MSISGVEPRTTWPVGQRCTAGIREVTAIWNGHNSFYILSKNGCKPASAKFGMIIIFAVLLETPRSDHIVDG